MTNTNCSNHAEINSWNYQWNDDKSLFHYPLVCVMNQIQILKPRRSWQQIGKESALLMTLFELILEERHEILIVTEYHTGQNFSPPCDPNTLCPADDNPTSVIIQSHKLNSILLQIQQSFHCQNFLSFLSNFHDPSTLEMKPWNSL